MMRSVLFFALGIILWARAQKTKRYRVHYCSYFTTYSYLETKLTSRLLEYLRGEIRGGRVLWYPTNRFSRNSNVLSLSCASSLFHALLVWSDIVYANFTGSRSPGIKQTSSLDLGIFQRDENLHDTKFLKSLDSGINFWVHDKKPLFFHFCCLRSCWVLRFFIDLYLFLLANLSEVKVVLALSRVSLCECSPQPATATSRYTS